MSKDQELDPKTLRKQSLALIYAAFIAGLCSIVYELLIATTVSYFLGDSVKYFSITIGLYMAAMGAGSYCSKFISKQILYRFLQFEVALALLGGFSIPLLYLAYINKAIFIPTYVVLTCSIGFIIGLEIPFLTRLMEGYAALKNNIANILSFDYVGALIATIAFPFFLLPVLGNFQSSLILGLINLTIIAVLLSYFSAGLGRKKPMIMLALTCAGTLLAAAVFYSSQALEEWDQALFEDRIVHAEQTPYQKIILTKNEDDIRLYLNGNVQFSSIDEHRYHEALVHYPLLYKTGEIKRVLLLGAGDGLAIKQLLQYSEIESIVLVDLDERVVKLSRDNVYLRALNQESLQDPKVDIVYSDAYTYLEKNMKKGTNYLFDFIISDLPDPNNIELARLYTKQFYQVAKANLNANGVLVTQSTSPFFATKAYWSIHDTLKSSGFNNVVPYRAYVPSFGDWGFVMASQAALEQRNNRIIQADSRYLNEQMLAGMRVFPEDIQRQQVEINTIDRPILLSYYLEGWQSYGF